MKSIKVQVQHVSMADLEEAGMELGDGGKEEQERYARFAKKHMLKGLTPRQRQVAFCLAELGMSRTETALHLMISLQAVHQIIPRMRKRLLRNGVRL